MTSPPRLAGLRFEVQAPRATPTLPRMDVAAFVGFAAAGPLHQPVAVEDSTQFTNIFGQDLPLAWDAERGVSTYAYLGPAVRAFFRNGGRRCWVIRVADTEDTLRRSGLLGKRPPARSNLFPLMGVVSLDAAGAWDQAAVAARSEGSWSDGVRVGAELLAEPIAATPFADAGKLLLSCAGRGTLAVGDLARITLPTSEHVVFVGIDTVSEVPASETAGSRIHPHTERAGGPQVWFSTRISPLLAARATRARMFDGALNPPVLPVVEAGLDEAGALVLYLDDSATQPPPTGTLVQVQFATPDDGTAWVTVTDWQPPGSANSPLHTFARVSGPVLVVLAAPPDPLPDPARGWTERLTLELRARLSVERWPGQSSGFPVRLSGLGFRPAHPRYWGDLAADLDVFAPTGASAGLLPAGRAALRQEITSPRFPLAAVADRQLTYLPLGVSRALDVSAMRAPDSSTDSALERDGLSAFGVDLFLDADLAEADAMVLLDQADFLRYQQPLPRPLTGVHAVLGLDEPALICVPDAVHRGWVKEVHHSPPPTVTPLSPLDLDDCLPPLVAATMLGQFRACGALASPMLLDIEPPISGAYSLTWSTQAEVAASYTLQESSADDFADGSPIYHGFEHSTTLEGRSDGTYFYRVRAESRTQVSQWSNVVAIRIGSSVRWRTLTADEFASQNLEGLHVALMNLGASSGDLLAVLSLPGHYREDAATQHVKRVAARVAFDRDRTLSFGALYHPWIVSRGDVAGDLRQIPPEGAMCGVMAARALGRGAWIAPANELLQGVLALAPPLVIDRRLELQEGHVNVLRQEPGGYLVLSANTLSDDDTLRPINVRRLMSLLRRLAVREGATYVFEPNDASFSRLVERGFEALLGDMFKRGAFAGATPDAAFQVNASAALNTPRQHDAGRFIVELRVAPTRPLTFLTIRLLESGQRELTVVEGAA